MSEVSDDGDMNSVNDSLDDMEDEEDEEDFEEELEEEDDYGDDIDDLEEDFEEEDDEENGANRGTFGDFVADNVTIKNKKSQKLSRKPRTRRTVKIGDQPKISIRGTYREYANQTSQATADGYFRELNIIKDEKVRENEKVREKYRNFRAILLNFYKKNNMMK